MRLGLYEPIKRTLSDPSTPEGKEPAWKKFAAGALSGAIGSAICNPADLLKTRAQAALPGQYKPLKWHVSDVYNNHGGLRGFYAGVTPTVLRASALGATYLGTYDTVKHKFIDHGVFKDGLLCQFASSVVSGFCITVTTSPFDNLKTRIMNQTSGHKYSGMLDCAYRVMKEHGPRGFYRGFTAQWCRFAPISII